MGVIYKLQDGIIKIDNWMLPDREEKGKANLWRSVSKVEWLEAFYSLKEPLTHLIWGIDENGNEKTDLFTIYLENTELIKPHCDKCGQTMPYNR